MFETRENHRANRMKIQEHEIIQLLSNTNGKMFKEHQSIFPHTQTKNSQSTQNLNCEKRQRKLKNNANIKM